MKGLKLHLAWQTLCYFNKPGAEAYGERMKIEREAARTWFLQMYRVKSSVKAPSDPCLLTSGPLRSTHGSDWYLDDVVVAGTGFYLFFPLKLKQKKILIFKFYTTREWEEKVTHNLKLIISDLLASSLAFLCSQKSRMEKELALNLIGWWRRRRKLCNADSEYYSTCSNLHLGKKWKWNLTQF